MLAVLQNFIHGERMLGGFVVTGMSDWLRRACAGTALGHSAALRMETWSPDNLMLHLLRGISDRHFEIPMVEREVSTSCSLEHHGCCRGRDRTDRTRR